MTSRTTSSTWLRGVIDCMVAAGLDARQLMTRAEITPELLADRQARAPTEKMSRLWRAALEESGDRAIGLIGAHAPLPGNFDALGYAMLSSQTLRAALQFISRYMRLVSDAAEVTLEPDQQLIAVRFQLYGGREPIPRQRIEFDLLTILNFIRWVAGRKIEPVRVQLMFPPPENQKPWEEAFGCPLVFSAPFNGWIFTAETLNAPLPAFNPAVAALHEDLLRQQAAAFDGASCATAVRREIARLLSQGEPRREQIALALKMGDRTLQRRLAAEGASFEKLLDATRCDLAQHYLASPHLTNMDVAYLLGFSDVGAFFRACRRWFAASPSQMRANLRETRVEMAPEA